MKKKIILILFLSLISFLLVAQDYTLYKNTGNFIEYGDILPTSSGIWLYKRNIYTNSCKMIKVDYSNNIIAEGGDFPIYYDDIELITMPKIFASDTIGNIYFYYIKSITTDSTELYVNKMDKNGQLIWGKLIKEGNFNILLEKGLIKDDKLVCFGFVHNLSENKVYSYAVSLSLENGEIIYRKKFTEAVSAFFDAIIIDDSDIMVLSIGKNGSVGGSKLILLDDSFNQKNSFLIPYENLFINNMVAINRNKFIISGYHYGEAIVILYDTETKEIIWETKLIKGWDDLPVELRLQDSTLYTLCSFFRFDDDKNSTESLIYSLSSTSGEKIDSVIIDNDINSITEITRFHFYKNKVYFSGSNLWESQSKLDGIWGTIDIDKLTKTNEIIRYASINIYPNITVSGQRIHYNTIENIKNIYIYDIAGKKINNCNFDSEFIELPNLQKGFYLLDFITFDNKRIVEKIIIR